MYVYCCYNITVFKIPESGLVFVAEALKLVCYNDHDYFILFFKKNICTPIMTLNNQPMLWLLTKKLNRFANRTFSHYYWWLHDGCVWWLWTKEVLLSRCSNIWYKYISCIWKVYVGLYLFSIRQLYICQYFLIRPNMIMFFQINQNGKTLHN